jgi:hypothetical protein
VLSVKTIPVFFRGTPGFSGVAHRQPQQTSSLWTNRKSGPCPSFISGFQAASDGRKTERARDGQFSQEFPETNHGKREKKNRKEASFRFPNQS